MKSYVLQRHNGQAECLVQNPEAGFKRLLDPAESLKLRNHSPTGFEFGYAGSGPAQLALAILLDFVRSYRPRLTDAIALDNYQGFKFRYIAIAKDGTIITSADVERFLANEAPNEVIFPNKK